MILLKKRIKIVALCCLALAQISTTCVKYNMATDGECLSSFSDMPTDSIYSVIACYADRVDSRIEQLIKPVTPFMLKDEWIRIVYNDSVDLPFVMKDVWGNNIDSILIDHPTVIAFEFKLLYPCSRRYPLTRVPLEELQSNGFLKLIEVPEYPDQAHRFITLFDLNKPYLDIMDERFEELYMYCCENGSYSCVYPWLYKNRPIMSDTAFMNSMHRLYMSNKYKVKESKKNLNRQHKRRNAEVK